MINVEVSDLLERRPELQGLVDELERLIQRDRGVRRPVQGAGARPGRLPDRDRRPGRAPLLAVRREGDHPLARARQRLRRRQPLPKAVRRARTCSSAADAPGRPLALPARAHRLAGRDGLLVVRRRAVDLRRPGPRAGGRAMGSIFPAYYGSGRLRRAAGRSALALWRAAGRRGALWLAAALVAGVMLGVPSSPASWSSPRPRVAPAAARPGGGNVGKEQFEHLHGSRCSSTAWCWSAPGARRCWPHGCSGGVGPRPAPSRYGSDPLL